jgi:hypothetical protein
MGVECWWNDTIREKKNYSERTPSECHFVQHESPVDWPAVVPRDPQLEVSD